MKLQKLLYYAQAWSLVWDGAPLFGERLEAWRDGPVSPHVYGKTTYEQLVGDADKLSGIQKATVDAVFSAYGQRDGTWLSELTHRERPWLEARQGLPPEARSKIEISLDTMRSFYGQQKWGTGKVFSPAYLRGQEVIVSLPEDEVALLYDASTVPADAFVDWLEKGEAAWDEEPSR